MKKTYIILLFAVVVAFISVTAFFLPSLSSDAWWHISSGREIINAGEIPAKDNFYCGAPVKWYSHEWLFDCGAFLLYKTGGERLLKSVSAGIFFITIMIFLFVAYKSAKNNMQASIMATLLACAIMIPYAEERPQLITMFSMAVFVMVSGFKFEKKNITYYFLLVPVALVWANCHSAAAAGVYLVFISVLFQILDAQNNEKKTLFFNAVILFLLLFVALQKTPLGFDGMTLFGADSWLKKYINEWQGIINKGGFGYIVYAAVIITAGLAAVIDPIRRFIKNDGRASAIRDLLLILPFFAAIFLTKKVIPVFIPLLVISLAGMFASIKKKIFTHILTFVLIILIGLFLIGREIVVYPEAAMKFLKNNNTGGCIFSSFEWGGYLENELYPKYKVAMNGRLNASEMTIRKFSNIYNVQGEFEKQIKESGIEYYLLPDNSPLAEYFKKKSFKSLYSDGLCVIYKTQ